MPRASEREGCVTSRLKARRLIQSEPPPPPLLLLLHVAFVPRTRRRRPCSSADKKQITRQRRQRATQLQSAVGEFRSAVAQRRVHDRPSACMTSVITIAPTDTAPPVNARQTGYHVMFCCASAIVALNAR